MAADVLTPLIYSTSHQSLSASFWMAAIINAVAFIFVIILNVIDSVNDARRKKLRYQRKTNEIRMLYNLNNASMVSMESQTKSLLGIEDKVHQ